MRKNSISNLYFLDRTISVYSKNWSAGTYASHAERHLAGLLQALEMVFCLLVVRPDVQLDAVHLRIVGRCLDGTDRLLRILIAVMLKDMPVLDEGLMVLDARLLREEVAVSVHRICFRVSQGNQVDSSLSLRRLQRVILALEDGRSLLLEVRRGLHDLTTNSNRGADV